MNGMKPFQQGVAFADLHLFVPALQQYAVTHRLFVIRLYLFNRFLLIILVYP